MARNAVSASQVHKALMSAGGVASKATGPTTATNEAIAWSVEVVAAVVTSEAAAGAIPVGAVAAPHLDIGMTDAGVAADRERVVLASYAKAAASSAMRRATLRGTAQTTVVVAVQCTEAQAGTKIVADTTEDPHSQGAAHPSTEVTTTVERGIKEAAHKAHHPVDTTVAPHLPRRTTGPVVTAVSATECLQCSESR